MKAKTVVKTILKILLGIGIAVFSVWLFAMLGLIVMFGLPELDEKLNGHKNAISRIEHYADAELPEDIKIEYHYYEDSFQDFSQYTRIKFECEPTAWLEANCFTAGPSEEFERNFFDYTGDEQRVPTEYRVDFSAKYRWFERWGENEPATLFVYFPDTQTLVFCMASF